MSYLLDTDRVVDALLGRPEMGVLMPELRRRGLSMSVITYMEIMEGIAGEQDSASALRAFRAFLRRTRMLIVSRAIARRAAEIRFDLRRQKRPIDHRALDILIAATAIEHDLILVTRNTRDYEDISGLQLHQAV